MPKRRSTKLAVFAAAAAAAAVATTALAAPREGKGKAGKGVLARGEYLVTIGGCNDCHTPLRMGQSGPEPDLTRMLSGHPEALKMPPAPALPEGPWGVTVAGTLTAWSGPWGTSFTANLTPDPETGLGKWTEKQFIETLRTGRHQGIGRQILPPMPWFNYGKATEDDLKAIFAYLRSIPPIRNKVPEPILPAGK
jgi:mono/diheme cytochrome c family protein